MLTTTHIPCTEDSPVLVTGASGFIGGRLAGMLQSTGTRVRAMARESSRLDHLPGSTEWVFGDIRDAGDVKRAIAGCKRIYHCAGLVSPLHYRMRDFDEVNVTGTANVLAGAKAMRVEKVVHTSSIIALGGLDGEIVTETVRDDSRQLARGYAESKREAEQMALSSASPEMAVTVVNPAVVYGPRDRHFSKFVGSFLRGWLRAIAFRDHKLSLVYIDDVARGLIAAMVGGQNRERYILSECTVTLDEFFAELSAVSGRNPPRWRVPDMIAKSGLRAMAIAAPITRRRAPLPIGSLDGNGPTYDGGRATRELSLEYTPLRVGLETTVRWYRQGKPENWPEVA